MPPPAIRQPPDTRAEEAPDPAPVGFQLLRTRAGTLLGPQGATATPIWGYQGVSPGPLLRVKRGEEVRARLINELPEPTAIHWHGARVPNPMDGAPGLTQTAVAAGARFAYRFRPPDEPSYPDTSDLRRTHRR